jgi:PAS domain S-box-containing protein
VFAENLVRIASTSKFSFSNKILENADLFVLVSDENGKIIYVNNYTLKQLNKTENELLGDGWWKMRGYKGDRLDHEIKEIHDMILTGQTKSAESKIVVNNEKITIEWNNFILDGKFIIGVGKNVTEELLLKDELLRLSSVATSVKNGIVITTSEGLITWCNKSYEDISGYALTELLGNRPSNFFKMPDFFKSKMEEILARGPYLSEPVEVPHYDKKGNLFWLLIISSHVYNEDGSVKEIIEICSDVTEQKELKDRYEYIVNNANDIIYTINIPGFFTYINPSIEKMLGFKPEDFIGRHYTTLIHKDDVKMVQMFYFDQVMTAQIESYLEFRVFDKDGNLRWVSQSVKLILNEGKIDQYSTIHAVVRDITSLKLNEIQLVESENNFRMINETIEDVFWLYDRSISKMLYISPSCYNVFGVSQETWYTEPAKWRNAIYELDKDVIAYADEMFVQKKNYEIDFRIVKDGEIRWIHEKIFMVTDEQGGVTKVSGIASDITIEKTINIELERLSLVAEKTNNAIIITDGDGLIEWSNSAFSELSGYELDEVIGTKPSSFLQGPSTDQRTIASIRRGLAKKSHIREELINYTRDGEPYWIELVIDPIFDGNGKVTNFIAVSSNIDERKQKEQLILNQTQDITDSINYASRIQSAILPDMKSMQSVFKEVAVCYKPRDIIGGDFYWATQRNELTYFAVADCTGHGVSGAFLTLIGNRILEEIVTNNALRDPAEILQKLDDQLYLALNNKDSAILRDGMEIALCVIDSKQNLLRYAGAGLGLLYVAKNETHYIKGQRKSIGDFRDDDFAFETKDIYFTGDEYFYLSTDGFQDQFGGENDKRYSKKRLISFLEDVSHAYPEKRENILNSEINEYIGLTAQTDDITVIGFGLEVVKKLVDFGPAKQAHLNWKLRISDFLNGKGTLTEEDAVSHTKSSLGLWYYSEGKKLYGHIAEMQQFEVEHEKLHNYVKDIMTYKALEDNDKAESLYFKLVQCSDTIVQLLSSAEDIINLGGNQSNVKTKK